MWAHSSQELRIWLDDASTVCFQIGHQDLKTWNSKFVFAKATDDKANINCQRNVIRDHQIGPCSGRINY